MLGRDRTIFGYYLIQFSKYNFCENLYLPTSHFSNTGGGYENIELPVEENSTLYDENVNIKVSLWVKPIYKPVLLRGIGEKCVTLWKVAM